MLGISIELGRYSLKILSYQIEKKGPKLIKCDEVVLDQSYGLNQEEKAEQIDSQWPQILEQISQYLQYIDQDYHLLMNLPSDIVSSRYLSFPVNNRKKAMMMLPFQIEEDLPYSIHDCHYADTLKIENNKTKVMVGLTHKEHFNSFFNQLESFRIEPKVLTSDISNHQAFIEANAVHFPEDFCVINLGHSTSRGFYFHEGELVANHQSYIAGALLTEAISQTYSISDEEATLYKHQNSFMLLEEQYDQVNENQRDFAKVMDSTLAPLLNDIKRWNIGHRVNFGKAINDIYICGGTSNIKNIQNYLAEKIGVNIHFFDPYQQLDSDKIDPDKKLRRKFAQVATLASVTTKKARLMNFLKDQYKFAGNSDLPLESTVFLTTRTTLIAGIMSLFFIVLGILNMTQHKRAQKVAQGLMKNKNINMPKPTINRGRKKPIVIVNKLNSKQKLVEQEVSVIKSALKPNSIHHLLQSLDFLSSSGAEIIRFVSTEDKKIDFVVKAKKLAVLKRIQKQFQADQTQKWFFDLNEKKLTLTVGGKGK